MTRLPASSAAATPITMCRGCGSRRLTRVLDLGEQPACDHFPPVDDPAPDPLWPLALTMCADCALVQLDHVSPAPEEPLALESETLKRHARDVSRTVLSRLGLPPGSTVREFASHHGGSWVAALTAAGCVVVNGTPAGVTVNGETVTDETVDDKSVDDGTAGDGRADLVVDNQSIIHAEDLETQLAQRVAALADDGVLVIEFHHALQQLEQGQFDTARHGHPLSFSLTSWANACRRHGLEVVDAWPEDVFGGCLIVAARRAGRGSVHRDVADILADRLRRRTSADFVAHLERARAAGRRVIAYGAGSKACTLLGVTGVGADLLPMVADLSPAKHGRRVPGVGIPIVSPEELVAAAPDEVMILTWDIAAEVIAQLHAMGLSGARFFVPLPRLAELTPD